MSPPVAVLAALAGVMLALPILASQPLLSSRAERSEAITQAPPDVAAPPAHALTTSSGVAMRVLQPGTGSDRPVDNDCVTVKFTAWKRDGRLFGKSGSAGGGEVQCLNVIAVGVADALKLMVTGEKRRLWVPAALTAAQQLRHGRGRSGQLASAEAAESAEPGSRETGTADLTYDIELIGIIKAPPTPVDLKAPPATAARTATGLAYRVLRKGQGREHPLVGSQVLLHFSGWTPNGRLFVSTVMAGHPAMFRIATMQPGWREAVQQMVAGEKARFWVPANLALGGKPPTKLAPSDALVYDIELLAVQ